jgi:hypothetical protein
MSAIKAEIQYQRSINSVLRMILAIFTPRIRLLTSAATFQRQGHHHLLRRDE